MKQDKYSNLVKLAGYSFPAYASPGTEPRAQAIATRCEQAYRFLIETLNPNTEICVLILAPEHWQVYTNSPMFGVPQTIDEQTIVVAGQNAELWKMIVPPLEILPSDHARAVQSTYGQVDGSVDVAGYMDLLPVHELSHLFIDQMAGQFDFHLPRRWLVELFCNLALHAYIVEREPNQLSNLTVFPQMIVALGHDHLQYRSLDNFEQLYASMEPPNFVWYLSRLHVAAHRIYDAAGTEAVRRLFKAIVESKERLTDEQLATHLQVLVHHVVADILTSWER